METTAVGTPTFVIPIEAERREESAFCVVLTTLVRWDEPLTVDE